MIFWIIAGVLALAVLLGAFYAYRVAFYVPPSYQENIFDLPTGEQYEHHLKVMRGCIEKLNDLPFESVTITSFDGKKLFGRYYHTRDGAPLQIQFHGYRGSAMRDFCGGTPFGRKLGHNVLLVDQRAHGKSEGQVITFGVLERFDCLSWCRYAYERFGADTPIILSGVSMGGATVLMASNLPLPETVKAIVADCPFSSPKAIIAKVAGELGLPGRPASGFCALGGLLYGRFRLGSASAVAAVKETKLPILLLHGEDDRYVPCHMSREIYDACGSEKELEIFPGAAHGMCYMEDPRRYEAAVEKFLQRCLSNVHTV